MILPPFEYHRPTTIEEALAIVASLVRDAGFDPVIVGPLARAREFDRNSRGNLVTGMTARQIRETLGLPEFRF